MFGHGFEGFFGQQSPEEEQHDDDPQHTLYYDILAVEQNATNEEIQKAYDRSQTKGPYKDPKYGGDPEKHQQLEDAYKTLIDPEKRKLYDKYGKKYHRILQQQQQEQENEQDYEDMDSGPFQSPFDIFQMLHGGGQRRPKQKKGLQKGKPQVKQLDVTLNDIYRGKKVSTEFTRKRLCETCKGIGGKNVQTCKSCKGHKMVVKMVQLGPGMYSQSTQPCYECNAQGEVIDSKDKCKTCNGQKIVNKEIVMEVQLDRGVPDEHDYKFDGQGDELPGFTPADLYFRVITEKHDIFTRKGADLHMNRDISLNEALTGFTLELKHLDASKFYIQSRPGEIIKQDDVKCIKGKGMPFYKSEGRFGNLYIKFNIVMPEQKSLSPDAIAQLQKALPGPQFQPYDQNEKYEFLDEYTESDFNTAAEGGRNKDEEDENEIPHEGARLQCNQQ